MKFKIVTERLPSNTAPFFLASCLIWNLGLVICFFSTLVDCQKLQKSKYASHYLVHLLFPFPTLVVSGGCGEGLSKMGGGDSAGKVGGGNSCKGGGLTLSRMDGGGDSSGGLMERSGCTAGWFLKWNPAELGEFKNSAMAKVSKVVNVCGSLRAKGNENFSVS
jgi:hypothetical protein